MHLDARPVELPLNERLAELLDRGLDRLDARGKHGFQRSQQPQPDLAQALLAGAKRDLGGLTQVARQHEGATQKRCRDAGAPGDGVGHDPLERALAELADQQAAQKQLLFLGRPRQERAQRVTASRLDTLAG